VNAVALLPDGRVVTSGEDARIAIWTPGAAQPARVLEGHKAPVVALAVSPDGQTLASRHGTAPRGSGRSTAALRAYSKVTATTSTAWRSRPTAAPSSPPAMTQRCASGR